MAKKRPLRPFGLRGRLPKSSHARSQALCGLADRVETAEHTDAMIGIYAWANRITTQVLAERSGLPVETVVD